MRSHAKEVGVLVQKLICPAPHFATAKVGLDVTINTRMPNEETMIVMIVETTMLHTRLVSKFLCLSNDFWLWSMSWVLILVAFQNKRSGDRDLFVRPESVRYMICFYVRSLSDTMICLHVRSLSGAWTVDINDAITCISYVNTAHKVAVIPLAVQLGIQEIW